MIKSIALAVSLFAATTVAVAANGDGGFLTKEERNAISRKVATRKDLVTIGTNRYWIVEYSVGSRYSHTKTNLVRDVFGKHQENPLEADAKVIRDFEKTARKAKHKDEQTWKNMVKDIEHARDKFIQQEFIDLANKLLNILDQVPEA